MKIQLSDHFTTKKLLRFVMPSISMMVFISIYGVVDGYFVSNYAGGDKFAATNLIWPYLALFQALGFMIGAGGTALVSLRLGEGKKKKANETFSLLVIFAITLGIIMTVIGEALIEPVATLLGATDDILPFCLSYGRIVLASLPFCMLQNVFQSFTVAAEKSKLGLLVTVIAGVTNIILDSLLVAVFGFGVKGAAVATAVSQTLGGIIPLVYFILPNSSLLRFTKPHWDFQAIIKTCTNGSSEFVSNISLSVVNMFYNKQLLRFAGNNGVAAYGVIMYVGFIFCAIYIGYSTGIAPVIAYNYGAKNHSELKNLFKKSLIAMGIFSLIMAASSFLLSEPIASLYVGYDKELMKLTTRAFLIFSPSFLFMGYNMFASSFFTALNNGAVSAVLSFNRTFFVQIITVLLMPYFWGIDGVWWSIAVSEFSALLVSVFFWIKMKNKYQYA